MIYDYNIISRPIDPEPGELFVATWRMRVIEASGYYDAGLVFAPDDGGTLNFQYYADRVVSTREQWSEPLAPNEFHTFRIESWDMEHYSLWIDGVYRREGVWDLDSINQSYVTFGDSGQGGSALSWAAWDYVRFGVIPEPSSLLLLGAVALWYRSRRG